MDNRPLKVGDMCIIVGCLNNDVNIGKSVILERFVPAGRIVSFADVVFQPPPENGWIFSGEDLIGWNIREGYHKSLVSCALVRHLRKIGDGDPEVVKDIQKEEPKELA